MSAYALACVYIDVVRACTDVYIDVVRACTDVYVPALTFTST